MANKAEKFIKRAIEESNYSPDLLNDRENLSTDVYWRMCGHLGNPDRLPIEYKKAYNEAFSS